MYNNGKQQRINTDALKNGQKRVCVGSVIVLKNKRTHKNI